MRSIAILFVIAFTHPTVFAQKKYFEGSITYQITVKSRIANLSDKLARQFLAIGNVQTISIKDGNYKQSSANADILIIRKDKKTYYKFRNLDTLYYQDYASDTTAVIGIKKTDSIVNINHFPCKGISIQTSSSTQRYYYSDSLRLNPEYDKENTLGQYNVYSRETNGRVYLWGRFEVSFAIQTDSCIRVEEKSIDDAVFNLPALPQKKFDASALFWPARLAGKEDAWQKYLSANLNANLANKYLKIPKGETENSQTVFVRFEVTENGTVGNIEVVNKNEVHPKLAEEAIRVIRESPRWLPGTIYGEKIPTTCKQSIVFKTMK